MKKLTILTVLSFFLLSTNNFVYAEENSSNNDKPVDIKIEKKKAQNSDDTIKEYTSKIEANPLDASSYVKRGKLYYDKKDYEAAIKDLKEALKLEPDNKDVILALRNATRDYGSQLIKEGKQEQGRDLLKESVKYGFESNSDQDKMTLVVIFQASQFYEKKQYGKAIELLEKIKDEKLLDEDTKKLLLTSYYENGEILLKKNNYKEAKENFKNAKELFPKIKNNSLEFQGLKMVIDGDYRKASIGSASKYLDEKKYSLAEKELTKLLKIEPNNTMAISDLGFSKFKQGKVADGINLMEMSVKLDNKDWVSLYNLACSYSLINKKTLAIKSLKQVVSLQPLVKEFIIQDNDLKNLKNEDGFKNLLK